MNPMNAQVRKYLEMMISMTTNCLMGGITPETWVSNSEIAVSQLRKILNKEAQKGGDDE